MYPMINQQIKIEITKSRKKGFSVKEIAMKFGIAQSTASLFVRDIPLNDRAQKILLKKSSLGRLKGTQTLIDNRVHRQEKAVVIAENLMNNFSHNQHMAYVIASLTYECEGGKSNFGVLEFTNSDPLLIKIFLSSLRKSFQLDENKFRVVMHLHSYHKETIEKAFWSKITSIPESKFTKTFQKKESGINIKEGYRGCVQIKYFDVSIKRALLASKFILANKMGL